jgi:hypothetical protein
MHLFGAEMGALADALKQGQHPLALGRESLSPAMERTAQSLGLQLGRRS